MKIEVKMKRQAKLLEFVNRVKRPRDVPEDTITDSHAYHEPCTSIQLAPPIFLTLDPPLTSVSSSKICVLRLQSDLHLLLQALAFEYTER